MKKFDFLAPSEVYVGEKRAVFTYACTSGISPRCFKTVERTQSFKKNISVCLQCKSARNQKLYKHKTVKGYNTTWKHLENC